MTSDGGVWCGWVSFYVSGEDSPVQSTVRSLFELKCLSSCGGLREKWETDTGVGWGGRGGVVGNNANIFFCIALEIPKKIRFSTLFA